MGIIINISIKSTFAFDATFTSSKWDNNTMQKFSETASG